MIKLVISDIDGTLVTSGKDISQANIEAIRKLQKNNIGFGVATGRDFHHAKDTFSHIDLTMEYLCCSGALYYSDQGEILSEYAIAKDKAGELFDILSDTGISHIIVTDKGNFSLDVDCAFGEFVKRVERIRGDAAAIDLSFLKIKEIEDLSKWFNEVKIYKFEIFSLDELLLDDVKQKVKNVNEVIALSSFPDNLEVTHMNAQKGVILEKTIALKGLKKEEVAIVGDSYNDISMFDLFKYSFAPESGLDHIKDKAFHVTRSCEEDGFSEAVEYILKNLNGDV